MFKSYFKLSSFVCYSRGVAVVIISSLVFVSFLFENLCAHCPQLLHYTSFLGLATMSEKSVAGKTVLKPHEVARPIHLQRLEAALDIRPFVNQVENILNSDDGSCSEDDSDSNILEKEMSRGDKLMHGILTTKQGKLSIFISIKTESLCN